MSVSRGFGWVVATATVLALFGCQGGGSDLGPRLVPIDAPIFAVVVHDDMGRPVVGARITFVGHTEVAVTGRSGRAKFRSLPPQTATMLVDGTYAAAVSGDRLGRIATTVTADGNQVPFVVHLPDLATSVGLSLTAGTQGSPSTLDDSGGSGAILGVGSGTSVGLASGAASSILRTGSVSPKHVPPTFATDRVWGRGILVDPIDATFTPGLDLDVPNDLGLAAGANARLLYLDPVTGQWQDAGVGVVDGGGTRIQISNAVTRGGLYVYAAQVLTTASVFGRIRNVEDEGVQDAMVRVGSGVARTAGDGSFTIDFLPATDAVGGSLTLDLEVTGGRGWWPISKTVSVPLVAGSNDVGDIEIDSIQVGNLRSLMIVRGRADSFRRLNVSAIEGLRAVTGTADVDGFVTFEDVEQGRTGFVSTKPFNIDAVLSTQTAFFFPQGQSELDVPVFGTELEWRQNANSTRVVAVDALGTGGIFEADVVLGFDPGEGRVGETAIDGSLFVDRDARGQAIAVVASSSDGRDVTSAFSMLDPKTGRIELPLERANRQELGAFDRHGLLVGNLTQSAGGGTVRRIRSTRILSTTEWFDVAFEGIENLGDYPVDVDPAMTGGTAFEIGLAAPGGVVTAVEGTMPGGGFAIDRVGLLLETATVEGGIVNQDIALDRTADAAFTATNALSGLEFALISGLEFDLGARLASGQVLDVARSVTGNAVPSGTDLTFQLPALTGALAGGEWLVGLQSSGPVSGRTETQQLFLELSPGVDPGLRFLDVPQIVSPTPGAMVSADDLEVVYTVPAGTTYVEVEIRSVLGNDTHVWRSLLPPEQDRITFLRLPDETPDPLISGRTYTVEVAAFRISDGLVPTLFFPYFSIANHFVGLSAADRGVDAISRQSFTVQTM